MPRTKFVACHLSISAVLVSLALAVVVILWYPGPHKQTPAFVDIVLLLILVDVTLGPLLSAIVYKPGKKSLKFDLGVIFLLQIGALAYGVTTLFDGRPAFMVFNIDRITAVAVNEFPEDSLARARPAYRRLSLTGPVLVGARMPTDERERQAVLMSALTAGIDLAQLPEYYRPFPELADDIRKQLKPLDALFGKNDGNRTMIEQALAELNASAEQIGYLPVQVKDQDYIALIRRDDAELLDYLPIDGW